MSTNPETKSSPSRIRLAREYLAELAKINPVTLPNLFVNSIFKRYDNEGIDRVLTVYDLLGKGHRLSSASNELCSSLHFDPNETSFYGFAMTTRALINKIGESSAAMEIVNRSPYSQSLDPEALNNLLLNSLRHCLESRLSYYNSHGLLFDDNFKGVHIDDLRAWLESTYKYGLMTGWKLGEHIKGWYFNVVVLEPMDLVNLMSIDVDVVKQMRPQLKSISPTMPTDRVVVATNLQYDYSPINF